MCWLNEKLARSCGEAELLSWTTVMGGFAGGIGRGRRASCAGFLGCCGCCSRCRGLAWGWYAGTGACVQVGNVLSWSSGLWDHPGEVSLVFWTGVFLSPGRRICVIGKETGPGPGGYG